jgi:hypothetical protein
MAVGDPGGGVGIPRRMMIQISVRCGVRVSAARSRIELVEELAWGEDRRVRVGEIEKVSVARDEGVRSRGAGKRDQVVIIGVRGDAGRSGGSATMTATAARPPINATAIAVVMNRRNFGRARTSASSSSTEGLTSSKRSLVHAVTT